MALPANRFTEREVQRLVEDLEELGRGAHVGARAEAQNTLHTRQARHELARRGRCKELEGLVTVRTKSTTDPADIVLWELERQNRVAVRFGVNSSHDLVLSISLLSSRCSAVD